MKGNPLLCNYDPVSPLFGGSVLATLQAAEDMEGDLVDMRHLDVTTSAVSANTTCYFLCYTLFCCECGLIFLHVRVGHVSSYNKDRCHRPLYWNGQTVGVTNDHM